MYDIVIPLETLPLVNITIVMEKHYNKVARQKLKYSVERDYTNGDREEDEIQWPYKYSSYLGDRFINKIFLTDPNRNRD